MPIASSVLDLIADTPIVKARGLDAGVCELYFKLESQNPGGSIKDRIGLAMIEAAAANGWIDRKASIVESVLSIRRAGADSVLTYWAAEACRLLGLSHR